MIYKHADDLGCKRGLGNAAMRTFATTGTLTLRHGRGLDRFAPITVVRLARLPIQKQTFGRVWREAGYTKTC